MKKLILFFVMPALLVGLTVGFGFKSSGGKAGATGSPNEGTCVQCHNSFELNSGDGSVALANADLEANNWEYMGGQTYDMELTIAHDGATLFGFGLEALNAAGENAGTLIISNSDETQLVNSGDRTNVTHKNGAGVANDTKTFVFQWTAPDDIDEVTFYYSGNAANGNGQNSGDYIYNSSQMLTRNTTGIANKPMTAKVRTFPNPVTDRVSFEIPEHIQDFYISVFNSVGQLVDTKLEKSFTVSSYEKGTYYVIVSDNQRNKLASANFVKL